jgi:hypothetical protein
MGAVQMDRETLIKRLESDESIEDELSASTLPEGGSGEALRMAVAKIREKRTKDGKPIGVKLDKKRRLTASQRAFAAYVTQGDSPAVAYRKAYPNCSANDATVSASANRLMKDARISALMGSVFEAVKETIVADAVATRRHVMEELFKHCGDTSHNISARLKALELMGRAVGMFTDKIEQKVEEISTEQLKKELKGHLSLLENVDRKRSA